MPGPESNPYSPWRRWLRPAIVVPIAASLAVHAAMLAGFIQIKLAEPPRRLTEAPVAETVLALTPPTPAASEQPPEEKTPEPDPTPPPAAEAVVVPRAPADPPSLSLATEMPVRKPPAPPPPRPIQATPPPAPPRPAEAVFAGVKSDRANRVVYVLDASGAMTTSLQFVKAELARSVARLEATQSFQVVVFRGQPGAAAASTESFDASSQLVPATDAAKTRLSIWLETVQPNGRSEPLAGLRAAMQFNPDLVFLLTRSIRRSGPDTTWGAGVNSTLAELERLNPKSGGGSRPAIIKALQFLDADPTGLLPAIANAHGDGPGSYRVVTLEELK